jgi:hypothetical protein
MRPPKRRESSSAGGLARQAVITVCPFELEGPRVLEPDARGRTMPAFLESWQENHGRDTVTWGRFPS